MPRSARCVIPKYLYHVTQRGNYRQNVFAEDQDRVTYLKYVQECAEEACVSIFAYCLMDNHVHFIVRPEQQSSLARLFSVAHMKYSHYFNRKRQARGHLWQGRFYSCMLSGEHIKEVVRYVECNPVRAGMAARAWDYSWSSARAHLGKEYKIISLADISEYFEVNSWREYLMEGEEDERLQVLRERTRKGLILVSLEFIKEMEVKLNRRLILQPRGRPKREENSVCP